MSKDEKLEVMQEIYFAIRNADVLDTMTPKEIGEAISYSIFDRIRELRISA